MASLGAITPTLAHAGDLQLAGRHGDANARRDARRQRFDERLHLEDFQREPKRKGFYAGAGLSTGLSLQLDGFIPAIGHRVEIGGGLSERFTLGVSGGLTGHQGIKKGVAGVVDIVGQGFVWRGAFLQVGLGATSHAAMIGRARRPGFGGFAGLGYEFRPLEHLAVAFDAQYEQRVRTDGRQTHALLFGLRLRGYVRLRKH